MLFLLPMSTVENSILGLKMPTDPRWVELAAISLEEILTDHAFCELKAATQCVSLIQLYPDKTELVEALAPIVTEEWGHFRIVLAEMKKRGYRLGRQRKDNYVNLLIEQQPKGIPADEKLLHKLMICALIEARSCERFRLLSEGLEDEQLRKFYYKFMISEAGHYRLFIDLATEYYSAEKVRIAWQHWLAIETKLLAQLAPAGSTMH
jgi:tRNA-(ms[2]io[6]A)-hydroxylase